MMRDVVMGDLSRIGKHICQLRKLLTHIMQKETPYPSKEWAIDSRDGSAEERPLFGAVVWYSWVRMM